MGLGKNDLRELCAKKMGQNYIQDKTFLERVRFALIVSYYFQLRQCFWPP